MSELLAQGAMPAAGETAVVDGVAAGAMVRSAREAAGVHVAALAVALKVPVSKLEALEAGRIESFPDAVFTRALASSVCRSLKLDPAPVLALLPQSQPPKLTTDKGINKTVKGTGKVAAIPSATTASGSRWVVVAVAVLLVAALALVFVPRGGLVMDGGALAGKTADAPVATVQAPSAPAVPPPVEAMEPAPPPTAPAVAAPAAAEPAPAVAVATPAVTPSVEIAAPATGDAASVLVIKARGESWVQVRPASGATQQRNLAAGETLVATGTAPWSVVVGKADATDVVVRGKPLDLLSIARENVARFEVK